MSIGNFPESLSQRILVRIILVGEIGRRGDDACSAPKIGALKRGL